MKTNDYRRYYQAVNFLESLFNLPIKDYLLQKESRSFYVERLRWFLKSLGEPEKNLKFIHVAGTAGKGSTVMAVHQILNSGGYRVGSFYSPHPTTSIERVLVGNKYISPDELADLVELLKPKLLETELKSPFGHPSYFETFLALGLLYFKKKKCQYVILEAGLGGSHDATNVILKPKITAITNINLDHTKILGTTLEKIATDKAGIIKPGSVFFTAEQRKPLLKIFAERCQKLKVSLHQINDRPDANRQLATAIARYLKIGDADIAKGLAKAKLPCRLETVQKKPLVILDGAHNPAKLKFLASKISTLSYKKLNLILGMAADKNLEQSLKQIVPLADRLILTRFLLTGRKSADLKKLRLIAKKIKPKIPVDIYLDPNQALEFGLKNSNKNDCLLITGSFFLAGELKKHYTSEEQILKKRASL